MILVPELKVIFLLTPRTGSGALQRAIRAKYPESIMLYRHMEADGVPHGYDRWKKVGIVRNPLDRLWSLYKFLDQFGDGKEVGPGGEYEENYVAKQRNSVDMTFQNWITSNEVVFTNQYSSRNGDQKEYWPHFSVLHSIPETRKSQYFYLRPDLGTQVVLYERMDYLRGEFKLDLREMVNKTPETPHPRLFGHKARDHMERFFSWEYSLGAWQLPD